MSRVTKTNDSSIHYSQLGAYLPHGVSYVKQFVDVTVKPEDMKRYYVHQGRMCIRDELYKNRSSRKTYS